MRNHIDTEFEKIKHSKERKSHPKKFRRDEKQRTLERKREREQKYAITYAELNNNDSDID